MFDIGAYFSKQHLKWRATLLMATLAPFVAGCSLTPTRTIQSSEEEIRADRQMAVLEHVKRISVSGEEGGWEQEVEPLPNREIFFSLDLQKPKSFAEWASERRKYIRDRSDVYSLGSRTTDENGVVRYDLGELFAASDIPLSVLLDERIDKNHGVNLMKQKDADEVPYIAVHTGPAADGDDSYALDTIDLYHPERPTALARFLPDSYWRDRLAEERDELSRDRWHGVCEKAAATAELYFRCMFADGMQWTNPLRNGGSSGELRVFGKPEGDTRPAAILEEGVGFAVGQAVHEEGTSAPSEFLGRYEFNDGRWFVGTFDGTDRAQGTLFRADGAMEYSGGFVDGEPDGVGLVAAASGEPAPVVMDRGHKLRRPDEEQATRAVERLEQREIAELRESVRERKKQRKKRTEQLQGKKAEMQERLDRYNGLDPEMVRKCACILDRDEEPEAMKSADFSRPYCGPMVTLATDAYRQQSEAEKKAQEEARQEAARERTRRKRPICLDWARAVDNGSPRREYLAKMESVERQLERERKALREAREAERRELERQRRIQAKRRAARIREHERRLARERERALERRAQRLAEAQAEREQEACKGWNGQGMPPCSCAAFLPPSTSANAACYK